MKSLLTVVIVTCLVSGCNSEQSSPMQQKTIAEPAPDTTPQVDPPVLMPEPQPPLEIPATPLDPPPPIFIGEGINTITQQPYRGTVTRGGDAYLRYNQEAQYFNDFELPEWLVHYRYEPFLEVLISNGSETLCARYSWKLKGFGYARPVCLWSDVRAAVPLEDMQSAYYGYSIVESRVWVNGAVWLGVKID